MLFTDEKRGNFAKDPAVVRLNDTYFLYYSTKIGENKYGIGISESSDLETFTKIGELPLTQACEQKGIAAPGAIVLGGKIHLFYQTYGNWENDAICHAVSGDGVHFDKNPENPVYRPENTWCIGRAIDADVCVFEGKLHLYIATRDHEMRVQKVGGAWASLESGFGKSAWTHLTNASILTPELRWEGECIEAPATIVHDGAIYMFYGGSYNCTPQQIGCAKSIDGAHFTRTSPLPFITNGDKGAWNESESGHPFAFKDKDEKMYLFYQGSPDKGKTWYLTKTQIGFENGKPVRKDLI